MAIKIGLHYPDYPGPGDIAIITGNNSSLSGNDFSGSIEYMASSGGSVPTVIAQGATFGSLVTHALMPDSTRHYETTNASIHEHRADFNISGILVDGAIGINNQLARGNLTVALDSGASFVTKSDSYIEPQSTLTVTQTQGGSYVNNGTASFNGGSADFAVDVKGSGKFDLEAYLSDPLQQTTCVVTFQGGVAGQSVHVGYGSQLNLGKALATQSSSFTEDPFSQVVLRGTQTTGFTYQNGMLDVRNGTVQVADLRIAPTGGANGFSITQIGADAVISAVGLSSQQIAQAFIGTPVLHYGS